MKSFVAGALGAGAVFCVVSGQPAKADPPLTVKITSCGAKQATVTGFVGPYVPGPPTADPGEMRQFLGIPYAAPPTGNNRWLPPKKPTCWTGDRPATFFGGQCAAGGNTNEDCLYLNVFTKPTGVVLKQPVIVFIHGGGLTSGSGSYQLNPVALVAKNVTVVTINYRIGALGFLAEPSLDKVDAQRTGNYGILDQIAALQWVKTNIKKFGGDPDNVTIAGQSAGGLSVLVHLISPLSNGLFHKAIIESGSFYNAATPLGDAEAQGTSFATSVGCTSSNNILRAKCLRQVSVATILAHQNMLGSSTRLLRQDGVVITDTLKNLLMTGQFKHVPVINGSNHDETRFHINGNTTLGTGNTCSFVSNIVPDSEAGSFSGAVTLHNALQSNGFSSGLIPTVEAHYPGGATGKSANLAYSNALTDVAYACRPLRVNKWIAQNGGTNYAYEFNDNRAPPWLFPPFTLHDGTVFDYGAYHGAELEYLFRMNNINACGGTFAALTTTQKLLAGKMVNYWTTFAKTGNPNPTGGVLPNWPQFSGGSMMSFVGGTPRTMLASDFDTNHKCSAFWDSNSQ
jgi:para-nitrobenzyl esterase